MYFYCLKSQFSFGVWYVTEKFGTKGTCLTYEFKTDNLGFKSIEQVKIARRSYDYRDNKDFVHRSMR